MNAQADELLATIRQVVREELQQRQGAQLALVQEQHLGNGEYACTVQLRDSEIVLKQVPVAVARIGLAAIPAVGDLVLLQFIGGDINAPVITGSLYNDEDVPPEHSDGQVLCQLPPQDDSGLHLLASSEGSLSLKLAIGGAVTLTLQDDDPVVIIDVGSGGTALTVDRDGALGISGGRGITLEAGADLVLKGANVSIEGSGEVTVKGAIINLN